MMQDHEPVFLYTKGMTNEDVPENIKRVKIDSNVKIIGQEAFKGRIDLYDVDFCEATSLEVIGEEAFYKCTSLLEVDFPSSSLVHTIENDAFCDCQNLVTVKGMDGVKVMGENVFKGCDKALLEVLAFLVSPTLLSKIPSGTFYGCSKLTKVTMVEGLKVIGEQAFYKCKSLSEVDIPSSVERIEREAFYQCLQLSKAKMTEGLQVIQEGAFYQCKSLLEVEIPSSVNMIEARAFWACNLLMRVKVKEGTLLKDLGRLTFSLCENLSEVDIPLPFVNNNVNGVFAGCKKLTMEDHEPVFVYTEGMMSEEKEIPKDVMRVKIDSNVQRIENGAFQYREGLYEVDFSEANSLKEIGKQAFRGCISLLEVDIPSSVNKIEEEAFKRCWNLAKVKLVDGLEVIGDNAFEYCIGLSEMDVPASVTFVGTEAFHTSIKFVTSTLGNNVALGIRLHVIYASQTQETIPLDKLVTLFSRKPIKPQELQDPTNQDELDLLQSIKSEYIKLITTAYHVLHEENEWIHLT